MMRLPSSGSGLQSLEPGPFDDGAVLGRGGALWYWAELDLGPGNGDDILYGGAGDHAITSFAGAD